MGDPHGNWNDYLAMKRPIFTNCVVVGTQTGFLVKVASIVIDCTTIRTTN